MCLVVHRTAYRKDLILDASLRVFTENGAQRLVCLPSIFHRSTFLSVYFMMVVLCDQHVIKTITSIFLLFPRVPVFALLPLAVVEVDLVVGSRAA